MPDATGHLAGVVPSVVQTVKRKSSLKNMNPPQPPTLPNTSAPETTPSSPVNEPSIPTSKSSQKAPIPQPELPPQREEFDYIKDLIPKQGGGAGKRAKGKGKGKGKGAKGKVEEVVKDDGKKHVRFAPEDDVYEV